MLRKSTEGFSVIERPWRAPVSWKCRSKIGLSVQTDTMALVRNAGGHSACRSVRNERHEDRGARSYLLLPSLLGLLLPPSPLPTQCLSDMSQDHEILYHDVMRLKLSVRFQGTLRHFFSPAPGLARNRPCLESISTQRRRLRRRVQVIS